MFYTCTCCNCIPQDKVWQHLQSFGLSLQPSSVWSNLQMALETNGNATVWSLFSVMLSQLFGASFYTYLYIPRNGLEPLVTSQNLAAYICYNPKWQDDCLSKSVKNTCFIVNVWQCREAIGCETIWRNKIEGLFIESWSGSAGYSASMLTKGAGQHRGRISCTSWPWVNSITPFSHVLSSKQPLKHWLRYNCYIGVNARGSSNVWK